MSINGKAVAFTALAVCFAASCIHAAALPGKGMALVPGDVAEFTTVKYSPNGEVSRRHSRIMMAMGSEGDLREVTVLSVHGERLTSSRTVFYDLSKERLEQGDLVESGTETIQIQGQDYECTWQKRRVGEVSVTFWRCPQLPFEHLAKMLVEISDGRKQITELVYFGPPEVETDQSRSFQVRLKRLMSQ